MSVWATPMVAAKRAVRPPTHATISRERGAISNSLWQRATLYTPAVTMVAAWISAETGVGPSMASGSQVKRGSWADLPQAPVKRRRAMAREVPVLTASVGLLNTSREVRVPKEVQSSMVTREKPKSPTRLRMRAFLPAARADSLGYQKRMRRYEQSPTASQPTKRRRKPPAMTRVSMEKTKRLR